MRLLVIGASGLVGSHMESVARDAGHAVFGTTRATGSPSLRCLNLDDISAIAGVLEETRPDVVIHAGGWTWVDGCEKDPARALHENAWQPAALAQESSRHKCRFVYLSSSYVFDGRLARPYRETDPVCPINSYGVSKVVGEQRVLAATAGDALIIRLICVWGRETKRKNFVYQVARAIRQRENLRIPADQVGNPTWAGDIARWTLRLLAEEQAGIWHFAGRDATMTRVEWAGAVREGLRRRAGWASAENWHPCAVTTAELGQSARRPLNGGLDTSRLAALAGKLDARAPGDLPEEMLVGLGD